MFKSAVSANTVKLSAVWTTLNSIDLSIFLKSKHSNLTAAIFKNSNKKRKKNYNFKMNYAINLNCDVSIDSWPNKWLSGLAEQHSHELGLNRQLS